MPDLQRGRRLGAILRVTFTLSCAAALAWLSPSCADTGHRYDNCTNDAGEDLCHLPSDGGPILPEGFVSDPVVLRHDTGANDENDSSDVITFGSNVVAVFRNSSNWSADASGQLIVKTSSDQGLHWSDGVALTVPAKDLRQPKLSVFGNKLHLTATSWDPSDVTAHRTNVFGWQSADATVFTSSTSTGFLAGFEAGRPREILSSLWIGTWRADELVPGTQSNAFAIYTSSDGATYASAPMAAQPTLGRGARQAEFIVRANNTLWLIVPERAVQGDPDQTTFCHTALVANVSWSCWSTTSFLVDSPVLFEQKGALYVVARRDVGTLRRTSIFEVAEADEDLQLVADLPGTQGDTGSPGITRLDANRLLLTYHSTSALDARVQALGHEPTVLEAESHGYATDVMAVQVDMRNIPAGR